MYLPQLRKSFDILSFNCNTASGFLFNIQVSHDVGHISKVWNKTRIGKAKAYLPIILSSFMLKTGKTARKFIRGTSLEQRPLQYDQHAYQSGKSCNTASYQIVSRLEASMNSEE